MPANPTVVRRIACLTLGTFVLAITTPVWGQTNPPRILPPHSIPTQVLSADPDDDNRSITAVASIIYVDDDAPGANDGTSWANAYLYLQDAIAAAKTQYYDGDPSNNVTEIRVAQGIYKPDRGANQTLGDRTATFALFNSGVLGVAIRGGYAGWGAPEPDTRDAAIYETVLSGDLTGDDVPLFAGDPPAPVLNDASHQDNSRHVVTVAESWVRATLDGLTVTAGNADGGDFSTNWLGTGGGMLMLPVYSSEEFRVTSVNCTFVHNQALFGGAVFQNGGTTEFRSCTFRDNLAGDNGAAVNLPYGGTGAFIDCLFVRNWVLGVSSVGGGAMLMGNGATPTLENCVFENNVAAQGGALSIIFGSSPSVTRCIFRRNIARVLYGGDGGAVYNGNANPVFTSCTFEENRADRSGAAVYNVLGQPRFSDCTFARNGAERPFFMGAVFNTDTNARFSDCTFVDNIGGAMSNSATSVTVEHCMFLRNQGGWVGGAVSEVLSSSLFDGCVFAANTHVLDFSSGGGAVGIYQHSTTQILNSVFTANQAAYWGGAILIGGASPKIVNCSIFGNLASVEGGGVFAEYDQTEATLANVILWGNRDGTGNLESGQLSLDLGATVDLRYSLVEGLSTLEGSGNIGNDPMFVDPDGADNQIGTLDDNLRLTSESPCIDAADNAVVPPFVSVDYDGTPRFVDEPVVPDTGAGRAPIVDMGAFEFLPDCNANGRFDEQDIAAGKSYDCNSNRRPDECEISKDSTAPGGPFFCTQSCNPDCNNNGIPDDCQVPQHGAVVVTWIGATGVWDNPPNTDWCLPEPPNNNENASFRVVIEGSNASVTLNTSPTITGLSLLGGAVLVVDDASGANVRTLHSDGDISNGGVFRATDRERLVLDARVIDQGGACGQGGALEATDGVLGAGEENDKSIVEINGSRVFGGTARTIGDHSEIHLLGGAELVNVCVDGVVVPDGQTGSFSGTIVNNDVLTVKGTTLSTRLEPTTTGAVLDGPGCVRLTSQAFARLGNFKAGFRNSSTHRIEGAGVVFGDVLNQGTVRADRAGQHLILFPPGAKTNDGLFEAISGGTLRIGDDVVGSGSYRARGGTILLTAPDESTSVHGASLDISGDNEGRSGALETGEGTTLQLSGAVTIYPNGVFDASGDSLADLRTLALEGCADPSCCSSVVAGITPPPKLKIRSAAQVLVRGDFRLKGVAESTNSSSAGMALGGNFDNQAICPGSFDWTSGSLALNGTAAQVFEVAGQDLGPAIVGFGTVGDSNFAIGTVEVQAGREVTFVDDFDNDSGGQGGCTEALYVHELVLRSGVSVTLDNCNVYYDSLIDEGAAVAVIGCGGLRKLPTGDADRNALVDLLDWNALLPCLNGPAHRPIEERCAVFDFDADGDVDLRDAAWFQQVFGAP